MQNINLFTYIILLFSITVNFGLTVSSNRPQRARDDKDVGKSLQYVRVVIQVVDKTNFKTTYRNDIHIVTCDRCYDLKNIFAKKISEKLAFFDSNKAKLCKNLIITLVFEKNANFFAEIWHKSQKIVIITSTPGLHTRTA
jgi:hypothetical protein